MKVKQYTKNNLLFTEVANESFVVTFCNLGASIYSIKFCGKEMLMVPKDSKDYLRDEVYHGKTIGRTPCRIKGNIIEIDGNSYEISANEGENVLHGGAQGLSKKPFDTSVKENANNTKVTFKYNSKDKEGGYPGLVKVKVTYIVWNSSSKLKVKFEASTNKPTMCALTNHSYFTLGEPTVENLSLMIKGSNYLKLNEEDLTPISKEPIFKELNFTRFKDIAKYLHSKKIEKGKMNGYDYYFYFDEPSKKAQVFLKSDKYLLKIKTDFEGVQTYTDNYADDIKWLNTSKERNRSIALEPMDNYLERKVLRPKEKYSRYIEYNFSKIQK